MAKRDSQLNIWQFLGRTESHDMSFRESKVNQRCLQDPSYHLSFQQQHRASIPSLYSGLILNTYLTMANTSRTWSNRQFASQGFKSFSSSNNISSALVANWDKIPCSTSIPNSRPFTSILDTLRMMSSHCVHYADFGWRCLTSFRIRGPSSPSVSHLETIIIDALTYTKNDNILHPTPQSPV